MKIRFQLQKLKISNSMHMWQKKLNIKVEIEFVQYLVGLFAFHFVALHHISLQKPFSFSILKIWDLLFFFSLASLFKRGLKSRRFHEVTGDPLCLSWVWSGSSSSYKYTCVFPLLIYQHQPAYAKLSSRSVFLTLIPAVINNHNNN